MKFELVNKTTDEVVDIVDFGLKITDLKTAKTFFIHRKQLNEEQFDKLFSVKEHPHVGRYDWWKEENTKLDDF